jgi:hypothetical protein
VRMGQYSSQELLWTPHQVLIWYKHSVAKHKHGTYSDCCPWLVTDIHSSANQTMYQQQHYPLRPGNCFVFKLAIIQHALQV